MSWLLSELEEKLAKQIGEAEEPLQEVEIEETAEVFAKAFQDSFTAVYHDSAMNRDSIEKSTAIFVNELERVLELRSRKYATPKNPWRDDEQETS